jgi:molybdopterin synthase catalytic subunit
VSVRITRRPLSFAAAARELEGPELGGVVLFAGRVRGDVSGGNRVVALDYEVHEGPAIRVMKELERTVRKKFGAERTLLWHRVGRVKVGEVSVIVGAACGHRAPAFAAAQYLIDRLKLTVPIWKEERGRSGHRRRPHPLPRVGRSAD